MDGDVYHETPAKYLWLAWKCKKAQARTRRLEAALRKIVDIASDMHSVEKDCMVHPGNDGDEMCLACYVQRVATEALESPEVGVSGLGPQTGEENSPILEDA